MPTVHCPVLKIADEATKNKNENNIYNLRMRHSHTLSRSSTPQSRTLRYLSHRHFCCCCCHRRSAQPPPMGQNNMRKINGIYARLQIFIYVPITSKLRRVHDPMRAMCVSSSPFWCVSWRGDWLKMQRAHQNETRWQNEMQSMNKYIIFFGDRANFRFPFSPASIAVIIVFGCNL